MAMELTLCRVALMAPWLSPVDAFAGTKIHRRAVAPAQNPARIHRSFPTTRSEPSLRSKNVGRGEDGREEDDDPLRSDQREGMADAFAALDSLTADDFDDLRPPSSASGEGPGGGAGTANMEVSARAFMDMQAELSARGEEGLYGDVLSDLAGGDSGDDAPKGYLETEEDVTALGRALDEAADIPAEDSPALEDVPSPLEDVDGIGAGAGPAPALTTADVSNDILTQEIKPSLPMEEFVASAIREAVDEIEVSSEASSTGGPGGTGDIAKTTEKLFENEELRKEIEVIFDRAGEKLRLEVEAMRKEQQAVTQGSSKQGLEYIEAEKQRISEAEESVKRLIQKVARETEEVERAMEDLEVAKNQIGTKGSDGGLEDAMIDLKKGGLAKQASLVGLLLFGSRAATETVLVFGSNYGEEHFVPAVVQATITLACAAYFALAK